MVCARDPQYYASYIQNEQQGSSPTPVDESQQPCLSSDSGVSDQFNNEPQRLDDENLEDVDVWLANLFK